jgi:serine-type D-Ala-D-Ala carboxypeptidase/endopeptidase
MTSTKLSVFAIAVSLLRTPAFAQAPIDSAAPPDAEIRKILADRIGDKDRGAALVVGVIDAKGRRVVSYGSLAKDDKRPLDGDTVFEIGSITKLFTSLVLMDMVQKGEVSLTDPVSKYLPASAKIPERNNKKITLQDLSTQSSGLPRMPSNFAPKDASNEFVDYSVEQLLQFLSGYQLTRDIGAQYEYSNLGVGLLGYALAQRAGVDYDTMVRSRICEPLGMNDSRVALAPGMKARLATGHGPVLNPVSNWDFSAAFAGAGALRSTANDMLKFLAANLGYTKTPLAASMAKQVSIRREAGMANMEIAYGWLVQSRGGRSIIWHNGGTGGYRSFVGFDPKSRVGVVVLTNVSTAAGPDDIGRHLLDASYPLATVEPIRERKEVTVDARIFNNYIGGYQLSFDAIMAITREGDRLFSQLTGQPKVQLFPEGEREFFLKVVDAQITFDTDAQGKATQLTLHQNGRDMPAKRIYDGKEHKEVTVDTKSFENYIGSYQLAPGVIMVISRDGDRLFSQLTGQSKFQLFPEGEREFFLKVVDAQITFDTDPQGKATRLTLHQNGRDTPAKRIDDAEAAALVDVLAKRFKDQKPAPGSEAALRRDIDELRIGEPKYELMNPDQAESTRRHLPELKSTINELGAVESVTFKGVAPDGADIYEVSFYNGVTEWRITLEPDGKIARVRYRRK